MSDDTALSFNALKIAFGDDVITENFNMNAKKGEFLCILGASGCGKSTSLRLMGDLVQPAAGVVTVLGSPPSESWDQLAYVFQTARLLPWLSARDNVALAMRLRRMPDGRKQHRRTADEALARMGLADVATRPAHQLSGGEKQRVAIARALAVQPQILLLDEPLSALDIRTRTQLRADLVDLWATTGLTVVFVTHDVDEAIALATRVIVLSSRPAKVVYDAEVRLPQPRDPRSRGFEELRGQMLSALWGGPYADEDAVETNRTIGRTSLEESA